MRWEIMTTKVHGHDAPNKWRKWFAAWIVRVYAYALRLYPTAFRAAYADEMLDVFAMTLRESMGTLGWLMVVGREVVTLPANIICIRQKQSLALTSSIQVWRARQLTRWSSLTLSLFMLHSLLNTLGTPQKFDMLRLSVFFGLLFLTSVSMLLAWRWERLGGLLTIASGASIGFFLTFYIAYFRPVEVSFIGLFLIGLLWMLPFVTFGVLFFQLSQYAVMDVERAKTPTLRN